MKSLVQIANYCLMNSSPYWEIVDFPETGQALVGRVVEKYNCMSGVSGSGTNVCIEDCSCQGMKKIIVYAEPYSAERARELGLE